VAITSGGGTQHLAADGFGRSVTDGWGSADAGGAYTITGTAANYKVQNGAGAIVLPQANANASALLYGVSARDVDIRFRVAPTSAPAGGNVIVYAVARRVSGGEYRARLSLNADGSVSVSVSKLVGSTETRIGSAVTLPGITVAAGASIWFRAHVSGAAPTTVRVKAWSDGQAEPSSWQLTDTDSESVIQAAGNVGFRLWASNTVTNSPIQLGFDDYTVDPS